MQFRFTDSPDSLIEKSPFNEPAFKIDFAVSYNLFDWLTLRLNATIFGCHSSST